MFIFVVGNAVAFESATYSTSESVGNFEEVRLVASQPFAKDTDVTISFADITATGEVHCTHILVQQPYMYVVCLYTLVQCSPWVS